MGGLREDPESGVEKEDTRQDSGKLKELKEISARHMIEKEVCGKAQDWYRWVQAAGKSKNTGRRTTE
jgi:hypothetical protein